jgi:TPR repeat protein
MPVKDNASNNEQSKANRRSYKEIYEEAKKLDILLMDLEALKKDNPLIKNVVNKYCTLIFGKTKWDKVKDKEKREDFLIKYKNFFPKKSGEFINSVLYTFALLEDDSETELSNSIMEAPLDTAINITTIVKDCKAALKDDSYMPDITKWSEKAAEHFYRMDVEILLKDEEKLAIYKKVMDRACKNGDEKALYDRAYAAYGGNEIYPCDWKLSEKYLLMLLNDDRTEDEEKGFIANSLGYIYYYGRINGGAPDFDKALRCYAIGASCGVTESVYKLGDMNLNGLGVPKNVYAAFNQYSRVFNDSRNAFLNGDMNCKLADAALRMGGLCENGQYFKQDYDMAYYFYSIAEYAIKKRMDIMDFYGDEVVESNIAKAIERIRGKVSDDDPSMKVYSAPFPEHIVMLLEGGETVEVKWEDMKGNVKLTAKRIPRDNQSKSPKLLIVHPQAHYCQAVDQVVEYATSIRAFRVKGNLKSFRANAVNFNKNTGKFDFYYNGELTACIDAGSFNYRMRE